MRSILLAIFFLASGRSIAQFPMDFFINKNDDAVVIYYVDHISIPAVHDTLPRPTSKSYDIHPITIEINPCRVTHELFLCTSDSTKFRIGFHFNKAYKCNKVTVESTSADCARTYFEKYIASTGKFKWRNDREGKKISSVPFREEIINDQAIVYYLEAAIEDQQIIFEEKSISKAEWSGLGKVW